MYTDWIWSPQKSTHIKKQQQQNSKTSKTNLQLKSSMFVQISKDGIYQKAWVMNTNTYNRCKCTENPKVITTVLESAKTKSKTKHIKKNKRI